jgi:hypothetical protein
VHGGAGMGLRTSVPRRLVGWCHGRRRGVEDGIRVF